MSEIKAVYPSHEPNFPATDQHPDAVRHHVGSVWVDAVGGPPTEAELQAVLNPPPAVPEFVTNLQARKAIRAAGLKPDVDAAVQAGSEELQEEWQFAQEIRRDSARIGELAGVLGLDDAALDALFIAAQAYPK